MKNKSLIFKTEKHDLCAADGLEELKREDKEDVEQKYIKSYYWYYNIMTSVNEENVKTSEVGRILHCSFTYLPCDNIMLVI